MDRVARLMQIAVNNDVFPGAVLLVSYRDEIVFHEAFGLADIDSGQLMTTNIFFDLASLTKPLATALSVMKLIEYKALTVDYKVGQILTGIDFRKGSSIIDEKMEITVDQLLRHTSGLPAYRPFYEKVILKHETDRQYTMRQLVIEEPLMARAGTQQIYSDLGYILLAWIIEKVSGSSIDEFVYEHVYKPSGIKNLFFIPIRKNNKISNDKPRYLLPLKNTMFASTEKCPWRHFTLRGEVHDDNAWSVGGVDGHAGLFGTASGVHSLLIELMHLLHGINSNIVDRDTLKSFVLKKNIETLSHSVKGCNSDDKLGKFEMVAGFDTPSTYRSSAGKYFSANSIGHLGFTGTSFWIDPISSIIVVLLSNRVHPDRNNNKIKLFRPQIHDLIVETLFYSYE